jgi:hypothetical protein
MTQWIATTRVPIGTGAQFLITERPDGQAPHVQVSDGSSQWSAPLQIDPVHS